MNSISEKIIQGRKEKGFNQKHFAQAIGVSQPSLIKFERGETGLIPLGVAQKISEELDIPFVDLFEIKNKNYDHLIEELKLYKEGIERLEKDLEKKEAYIENLMYQIKTVRMHLVDFIVDTVEDWLESYLNYKDSTESNFLKISEKVKNDTKLSERIRHLQKDIKAYLRNGFFTLEDYEWNLKIRKEAGLPMIDILKISIT